MAQEAAAQGDTNSMTQINEEFAQNKATVIEMLIENCLAVDTSIPRVVCGRFEDPQ